MKWIKITFLISAILHLKVNASPTGAPLEACDSMLPSHFPFSPQTSDPPVSINVTKWAIFPNERVEITIQADEGTQFRGFFVQARALSDEIPIGRFTPRNEVSAINCFGMIQSAATHTNSLPKSEVILEWDAPDITDPLVFELYVTIVESSSIFWQPKRVGLLAVVPEPTTTDLPGDLEWIYEGCGVMKLCYGVPDGCVDAANCNMFGAVTHDNGIFEFELLSIPNHNYIAFGLSQTPSMQDTSVIECVRTIDVPESIAAHSSWNAPFAGNSRDNVPQNIIRLLESRVIDGRIYCRVERDAISTVNGVIIDLTNEQHHLLLAGGTTLLLESIGPHFNDRSVTSDRYWLVDPPQITPPPGDFDWIYEGCNDTKVCYGLPDNCVEQRNCNIFGGVTYNNGEFDFELLSNPNHRYVAFGLSESSNMNDASVIECIQPVDQPGTVLAFTSWNFPGRRNERIGVPQNIIHLQEASLIDGRIYCRIRRDSLSVVNGFTFDLVNEQHHLLLAGGSTLGVNSVLGHSIRGATTDRYWLREPTPDLPIYDGCETTKLCFGVPSGCYLNRNCNMLATVYDNNGDFEFELLGFAGHNYVAFGLSQTPFMGDSSVIECVQQTPGVITAFTSWNLQGSNNRIDVSQNIIRSLETSLIDGRIYCKLQRDTVSQVRGQTFDLRNEQHFLLIAGGLFFNPDSVGFHTSEDRAISSERLWLSNPPEIPTTTPTTTTTTTLSPDLPIYDGCGTTKLCFGIPNRCSSTRNCNMLATVFYNNDNFEFELLGMATHNYIAFGLSQTSAMGVASVIECVQQIPGTITAFTSWNEEGFSNNRNNVPQNIIRTLETSLIDGRIYCKLQRDTISQKRGQIFHLKDQQHYLLIAGGIFFNLNSVGQHTPSDRAVSGDRYWLTDPREVQKAPLSALLLTHGSLMIVAWIGLTSIGVVIARYFKTSWENRKIFGTDAWFVWHGLCMFLTWALTLTSFIIIFVDVGQWNTSIHAVMGCVVLALVNLQAIGGAMRPKPKAKGRLLFNWMHKSFGNITHLLAVLTIFFAVPLSQARLPVYTTYVLVGFISYYLLMHIILTSIDVCSQMRRKKRLGVETNKNARFELLKRTLLGLHVVMVTLFAIALVLIFTLNPF